jgi:hypothetical protein
VKWGLAGLKGTLCNLRYFGLFVALCGASQNAKVGLG